MQQLEIYNIIIYIIYIYMILQLSTTLVEKTAHVSLLLSDLRTLNHSLSLFAGDVCNVVVGRVHR